MAEVQNQVDYVEVKAKDILTDRQTAWAQFTRATTWTIGVVVVVLVALKLLFG